MALSTDNLCKIASFGGSIKIDASEKSTDNLCKIAKALKKGAKLILTNASIKSTDNLCKIAAASPGNVIFEL